MLDRQRAVGCVVLLREHFHRAEVQSQPGAPEFVVLFFGIAFGDEENTMPPGQARKGTGYSWQKLDLMFRDRLDELGDAGTVFFSELHIGKLF